MRGAPSAARKTLPQPRAKRREAPRERAVPAFRARPDVATTVHGISQRMSARKTGLSAATAHSGRNSVEFRRPVRGSESASQRARKRFRKRLQIRLRIRLRSRERSGAKRRESERSRRFPHGPPLPQVFTAFRNACQRGRRGCPQQPLTLAVVLPERRRVVRGSESASQRIQKRFRKRLRIRLQIRLQSRERSGPKARESERSRRFAHGPPWPQLCAAFRNACQRGRRGCPQQPLTLAVVLPERRRVVRGSESASQRARKPFRKRLRYAFRAASGAARSAAGTRGPGAARTARRGHNCPRHFATYVSAEDGAVRSNRSLWPEFFRIPAPRSRL